jgi:4-amino-4-deoxy-L-arabinose transferase-like glycosyltransferase
MSAANDGLIGGSRRAVPQRLLARRLTPATGLLLIVAAALLLRLLWLDADAAVTLTWSGAPLTDEGLYSHAARNQALFGVWRTDAWDNRLVSPLFDLLAFGVYSLFGVGYVQLRLISVLFATAAVPLFWHFLRVDLGPRWALLAAALWSCDYFWLQYSRLGLLEPSMIAWLIAAAWCWRRSLSGSLWWAIGCGVCAAIGWVWKSLAVLFLPAPLLALLLIGGITWRRRGRIGGGYLLGLALVIGVYIGAWYLPQQDALARYNQFYAADRLPASLAEAGRTLWHNLRAREIWAQTPLIALTALVGGGRALIARWRGALRPSVALCLAWTICGAALLVMPYSPSRYYTLLLPALVGLAVASLAAPVSSRWQPIARGMAAALICLCLAWDGWWYAQWALHRRTTLIDSSRALQRLVPPDELVFGVTACGLSLANELRCAPPFAGLVNDDRPLTRLNVRYVLVEDGSRDDYMRRFYGSLLARATPIQRLPLGPRFVTLYRLPQQDAP